MKKISLILVLVLALTSFAGTTVFALDNNMQATNTNKAVMSVELGTRDLNSEQIKLLQSDRDLATARSKKDAENILKVAEAEMNNACAQGSNTLVSGDVNKAVVLAASTST